MKKEQITKEAERRFPIKEEKRASNGELYQIDSDKPERELFIQACEWMQSQEPDVREVLMEFFIMLNKNDMIKNLYVHPKHYVDYYLSTLPDKDKTI